MFENRTIPLLAYPPETVLAEKLETILSRGEANTRLRDFYDVYILQREDFVVTPDALRYALLATVERADTRICFIHMRLSLTESDRATQCVYNG